MDRKYCWTSGFHGIRITPGPALVALDRGLDPIPGAAGIGVEDKSAAQRRLDKIHHRVMNHAVAERRGGDDARLAFINAEEAVARAVLGARELALQREELMFQIEAERGHARFLPLPRRALR
jgi:hypothetical protein